MSRMLSNDKKYHVAVADDDFKNRDILEQENSLKIRLG